MAVSVSQIAWLAGLLEGEACFMVRNRSVKGRHYKNVYIQLVMTDLDVVSRAASILGVDVRACPWRPLSTKAIWRTAIHGDRAAGWMMTIYSLMGERRKEKIRECIETWRRSPGKNRAQRATKELRAQEVA